ncbi:hypothetical protein D3C76_1073010 [compost metagenome]
MCWIDFNEPKRETISPRWRRSKKATGKRTRWLKTLICHCALSMVPRYINAQERPSARVCCITSNRPKPIASTASRSRSALTSTLSITVCKKNGLSTMHSSSAAASNSTWLSTPPKPCTRPSN